MSNASTKKYEQLKQTIINHIEDLTWAPGDRLPVESYFCERFGISRITIQRAKSDLVASGYLEQLPGRKGHFVKKRTPEHTGTGLVAVTIDDISIPFAASILKGIEDKLREHGLHTVICSGNYDPRGVEEFISSVRSRGADGVIFTPIMGADYQQKNRTILLPAIEAGLPVVFVDRGITGGNFQSVFSNNYQAAYDMTTHLLADGKNKILLLKGVSCSSVASRWQGYVDACRDAGVQPDSELMFTADDLSYISDPSARPGIRAAFREFMDNIGSFDSCFCLNHTCFELLNAYLAGSSLLDGLEIAAYDFLPTENQSFPYTLHSVVQQTYRIGWEAANLLVRAVQDGDLPLINMTVKSILHFNV